MEIRYFVASSILPFQSCNNKPLNDSPTMDAYPPSV